MIPPWPLYLDEVIDPENTLYLDLPAGRVVIGCLPEAAPNHVARMKELARKGYFDGLPFHRVIEGYIAQGGKADYLDDMKGDPRVAEMRQNLKAEFSDVSHKRGIVSMARSAHPDSASTEFFIMSGDGPKLDGQYTAWGRVVAGMEHIDALEEGKKSVTFPLDDGREMTISGLVENPVRIVSMKVAADVALSPKQKNAPVPLGPA
jgi:peptidylprolyl isomerase